MMVKVMQCFLLSVAVILTGVATHQGDTQLGDPVTLPCHYGRTHSGLDIQWWTGEHLVAGFQLGRIIYGERYINRSHFSAEGLRNGDFSLNITHTEYSDSGQYRCVLSKEGQEVALGEVDIKVKVPRSERAVFVESGQRVVLACYGHVDWSGSEAAFVQWKRWSWVVLQWKSGSLYVHPMFKSRVSVPKERIVHGDISLIFNDTHLDDQGYYMCFFKGNDDITTAANINLTVTGQLSRANKMPGSQLDFPLHVESPVTLSFLPTGGNHTVLVGETERHQLICAGYYCNRTLLQNNSLIIRNITSSDAGTFIMREKGTGRTMNVLIVQIISTGNDKITFGTGAVSSIGVGLLVLLAISAYVCYNRQSLKRFKEHGTRINQENEVVKGSEMQPLQSKEFVQSQEQNSAFELSVPKVVVIGT